MRLPRANPSPLAGEGGSSRSGEPGEGDFANCNERPVNTTKRTLTRPHLVRAPSPARGEGKCAATSTLQKHRSRKLRKTMTDAERKLWFAIRDRRFAGAKFRRQVPIESFIADFCCFELRLIVEVDGGQHNGSRRDVQRDRWFMANGYRTLRFWNNDVLRNLDGVLTQLVAEIARLEREIAR